ncbi:PAS domain-containing sensor histidine kinase [Azospirillum thermophilum]|uniref:histidine kinase n=1 Tax=Azospirillum thermophilum TaxID=2202148 RepID=A0A2S2CYR7_9PROT|nr:PAS domain-containing sensor histidine kinase [Azospirillum thermophilum]AWK89387.1 hybrid sensor histidine kinase/response regulator [Azospirillum thermophilum]
MGNDLPAANPAEPISVERRFQLLVDSVKDYAIYLLDPNGIVSSWNTGAQRFKGYTADEIIGRSFGVFYTEEDRRAGLPQRVLATALAEGKFEAEGWRVRKDGSRFWASVLLEPIRDEQGRLLGFAKVTRDVTERRQAQKALEEAREALFQSQKMEAVGQLTGGVAHDFNNLLQAIIGSLEMIERRLEEGRTDVQPFIAATRTAADRAAALTQRLLAFSRRQPLAPRRVDLNSLVTGMRDLIRQSVGAAVQVELRLARDLWTTWADPNQVENALLNLAINARDAMPDGGRLIVRTTNGKLDEEAVAHEPGLVAGDYVVLSVADTGVGMTPEVADRAFEPFFTTKPVGQGTGLGLSQLYGFARQSGGDVRIDSAPGRGTTVTLYLPRCVGAADPVPVPQKPVVPEPQAGRGTILVVEDEALVRMLLVEALEEQGYTVLQAEDGSAAATVLAGSRRVDLLATDVGLPGINGRQLAQMARSLRPELKVLFLTGYAYGASLDKEPLGPGTQLLSKPVAIDVFLAKVRTMLTPAGGGLPLAAPLSGAPDDPPPVF